MSYDHACLPARPHGCRLPQIWHWCRPIGRGREGAAACRRVPLSADAVYISMGRFLELTFTSGEAAAAAGSTHAYRMKQLRGLRCTNALP